MSSDFRPGLLGTPQSAWPLQTSLTRPSQKMTVVAFIHPKCTCTGATVNHLVHCLKGRPDIHLVVSVFVPSGIPEPEMEAWRNGEHVKTLRAALPKTTFYYDEGGVEARRFGALTSGTLLAYEPRGLEVFRGGITNRRGGEQDNPALRRFVGVLKNKQPAGAAACTPVFGCPLVKSEKPGDSTP